MMRMSVTYVSASLISENARAPLDVFRSVPSAGWCEELQRFFDQAKVGTNCLTGRQLYSITRTVLFRVASAIVVNFLVISQFDVGDDDLNHLVECSESEPK